MSGVDVVDKGVQVPPEGRLEGLSVPELVFDLHRYRHTGALLVERQGIRKVLYFRDGRVVFAASTDPEDRLGSFLFRRGEVDLAPLLQAGGEIVRGRRLGQILVEQGLMDRATLVRAVLDHVREIALSIFPWTDGRWRLSRACLPSDESITLEIATDELVLAGVRRVRDGGRVRRTIGGPRAVYRATSSAAAETSALGMTERAILDELRRPCRVDRLCSEIFAPSEVVYRSLWALTILGLAERVTGLVVDAAPASNADHRAGDLATCGGATELLLDLGDERFTGAVHLYRGTTEASIFLRDGIVEFARTADAELSLAAHLLRRGVISDRDRDDAARRLVSGKRIGTLLAEQGALDYQDLRRFVREQVFEIVKRLALWETGEFELEDGETIDEQIVLGKSPEDVIMAGYEALDACERIWNELGGLDTVYRLRPEYLVRLDRMTLRPGVWELVSMLGQQRTVRDLLLGRPEPDFEVCRWLCGLARVRIVERFATPALAARSAAVEACAPPLADPAEPPVPTTPVVLDPATAVAIAPELFTPRERNPVAAKPYAPDFDATGTVESVVYEIEEPTGGWDTPVQDGIAENVASDEPPIAIDESPDVVAAWAAAEMTPPPAETVVDVAGHDAGLTEAAAPDAIELEPACEPECEPQECACEEEPPTLPETVHDELDVAAADVVEPDAVDTAENDVEAAASDAACPVESAAAIEPATDEPGLDIPADPAPQPPPADPSLLEVELVRGAAITGEPVPEVPAEKPWYAGLERGATEAREREPAPEPDEYTGSWQIIEPTGWVPDDTPRVAPAIAAAEIAPLAIVEWPADAPADAVSAAEVSPEPAAPVPDAVVTEPPPDRVTTLEVPAGARGRAEQRDVPIPPEVSDAVARFNPRHRVVFEALKREIGAGVKNFIATCARRMRTGSEVFDGLAPDASGAFDAEALGRALVLNDTGPDVLDALIDQELALVRHLLDPRRLTAIEEQLADL